jgi:hypothetical protein
MQVTVFDVIVYIISLQNNAAFHNVIQRVRVPLPHDPCFYPATAI